MAKLTMGQKIRAFWEKNKYDILMGGMFLVMVTGMGFGIEHAAKKELERQEEKKAQQKAAYEAERAAALAEEERRQEHIRNAPENQIKGGGYVQEDDIYETDAPSCIVNEVPLSSMGEFGEDMIRRLKEEYPDWQETGMFNPETAEVSAVVYIMDGEDHEESHEKQAS